MRFQLFCNQAAAPSQFNPTRATLIQSNVQSAAPIDGAAYNGALRQEEDPNNIPQFVFEPPRSSRSLSSSSSSLFSSSSSTSLAGKSVVKGMSEGSPADLVRQACSGFRCGDVATANSSTLSLRSHPSAVQVFSQAISTLGSSTSDESLELFHAIKGLEAVLLKR